MNIESICQDIYKLANTIYSELGGGFNEAVTQNALAIELRENRINYLKEVNIEIFYKGHSIGADRPDFILLPTKKKLWGLTEPIVLETKIAPSITNDHRQQLKSYFKSFPHNRNSTLHPIKKGILLKFLKSEHFDNPEKTKPAIELEFWVYHRKSGAMNRRFVMPIIDG